MIKTYRERYPDNVIGLSSHDSGIAMALVAYILGARVIEKHFTFKRSEGGPDAEFSMEPDELKDLSSSIKMAHKALGKGSFEMKNDCQMILPGETGSILAIVLS